MSNQRKKIIVNEIAFWKQNKMLPAHYCDFLTSLYTGGEPNEEEIIPNPKESIIAKEKKMATLKFILFPIIAVVATVLLQFVKIDWLAISIGLILGIAISILGIRFALKKHLAAPLLHMSGALLILAMTVKLAITYFGGNNAFLLGILSINCGLWVILGIWQRLIYFTLAGGLGILVVVGYGIFFL